MTITSTPAVTGFAAFLTSIADDGVALVDELAGSVLDGDRRVDLDGSANDGRRGARIPGPRLADLASDALSAIAAAPSPLEAAFAGTDADALDIKVAADEAVVALTDLVVAFAGTDAFAREESGKVLVIVGHVDEGPARAAFVALGRLATALNTLAPAGTAAP